MCKALRSTLKTPLILLTLLIGSYAHASYSAQGKHSFADQNPSTATTDAAGATTSAAGEFDPINIESYNWLATAASPWKIAQPTSTEALARKNQPWLDQIKLPYGNQLGALNGLSIIIGVADTALETSHAQLQHKLKMSYNGFDGSSNVAITQDSVQNYDHATTVTSAALGKLTSVGTSPSSKYIQGAAVGANLAMAQVFNDEPGETWSWTAFTDSINWLTDVAKVPIVNLSLGGYSPFTHEAYMALRNSISKGTLFVIAAGNEGQSQSAYPAAYASAAWAQGQIVAVGAVDKNNQLAYFSNAAGVIAPWYVVAPGKDLLLGNVGNTYAVGSGTSFAAPIVAGQAALIKDRWPHLKAATIAQIIFQTATPLGNSPAGTPDPIYGWGLINAEKSLQPIGILEVQLKNGSKIPVTLLSTGTMEGAIGSALRMASKSKQFMIGGATDVFSRQYSVDPDDADKPKPFVHSLHKIMDTGEQQMRAVDTTLDQQGSQLRYFMQSRAITANRSGLLAQQENTQLNQIGLVKRFANGNEFAAALGGENMYMGLADYRFDGAPSLNNAGFKNAYLGLVPLASSFGIGRKLDNGIKVKFGFANTQLSQTMLDQTRPNFILQGNNNTQQSKVNMHHFEISKQFDKTILGLAMGGVGEKNAILGTQMGRGFSFNSDAKTRVFTFNLAHQIAQNVVLAGYFSHGTTAGYDNPDSLVTRVSKLRSKAYGLGLAMNDTWRKADRLTINLSSPLATSSGSMTLDIPDGVDLDGNIIRAQRQISLVSPVREYRADLSYFTPLSKTTGLGMNLIHRLNANNIASATEQVAMMNYQVRF